MVFKDSSLTTEERRETSWNIVAQNSDFIIYLLRKATNSRSGNFEEYFWTLTSVRDNINYALQKEERESLDEIEVKIINLMSTIRKPKKPEEFMMLRSQLFFNIRKYHHAIMDLLEILGYFPKKENREKMSF